MPCLSVCPPVRLRVFVLRLCQLSTVKEGKQKVNWPYNDIEKGGCRSERENVVHVAIASGSETEKGGSNTVWWLPRVLGTRSLLVLLADLMPALLLLLLLLPPPSKPADAAAAVASDRTEKKEKERGTSVAFIVFVAVLVVVDCLCKLFLM